MTLHARLTLLAIQFAEDVVRAVMVQPIESLAPKQRRRVKKIG